MSDETELEDGEYIAPSLDSVIRFMVAHPERHVTATAALEGTTYDLSTWRNGNIVLRPRPPL